MTDLLGIALTGVKAYTRALEVVGDNVANASAAGYVRRTSTLSELIPAKTAPTEIDRTAGNGVLLTGIERAVDLLRTDTLRRNEGDVSALDTADRWLTKLQATLTGATALDDPMASFFAAASSLAADPANLAVRGTFLQQADTLAARFNSGSAAIERVGADIGLEAKTEVAKFNTLAQALAAVNGQLRRSTPDTNAAAALSDQRDKLLAEMSTYTTIDVRLDARGQAQVRVPDAGGPILVDSDRAKLLRVQGAPGGGLEMRVGPPGSDEPATLLSGSIAGLSVAAKMVDQTRASLDSLANRFATEMNAQHMSGVDLNGNLGTPLFATLTAVPTPAAANGGSARVTATMADGATPSGMHVTYDGSTGQWTLERDDLGASVTGTMPLTLDGVTIEANGAPRNGDTFHIAIKDGAAGIALRPLSAQEVAAAPRFMAEAAGGNLGDGRAMVTSGVPLVPPATPPFTVATLAAGVQELRDANGTLLASGPVGSILAGDGFSVQVLGTPAEGDSFFVRPTAANSSANGNALALLDLQNQGGTLGTYGDVKDKMLTSVSVPLAEIQSRLEVATAARDTAAEELNRISGVDLNTEAADMLRLQQAYSANARIIQTARDTFQAILDAGR